MYLCYYRHLIHPSGDSAAEYSNGRVQDSLDPSSSGTTARPGDPSLPPDSQKFNTFVQFIGKISLPINLCIIHNHIFKH